MEKLPGAKLNSQTKILIVDDEQNARTTLNDILTESQYTIVEAANGAEALEAIHIGKIDLVLLDIRMPGMDGIEVLSKIKEIDKNIGVIMITAFGSLENAMQAIKLGAYDYITKPFDPQFIKSVIKRCLESMRKGGRKKA